jgi:hypothetical protein
MRAADQAVGVMILLLLISDHLAVLVGEGTVVETMNQEVTDKLTQEVVEAERVETVLGKMEAMAEVE